MSDGRIICLRDEKERCPIWERVASLEAEVARLREGLRLAEEDAAAEHARAGEQILVMDKRAEPLTTVRFEANTRYAIRRLAEEKKVRPWHWELSKGKVVSDSSPPYRYLCPLCGWESACSSGCQNCGVAFSDSRDLPEAE